MRSLLYRLNYKSNFDWFEFTLLELPFFSETRLKMLTNLSILVFMYFFLNCLDIICGTQLRCLV